MTTLERPDSVGSDRPVPDGVFLSRPGFRERSLVLLALFLYAWGTPPEWLVFASGGQAESSLLTQALFLMLLVHTVVCLNGNWHVVLRAVKAEPLMAWFVGLALVSAVWSTVPVATFQDGVVLIIAYTTAMHLVVRFELRETVRMLATVFAIGAVLNFGFIAAFESLNSFNFSVSAGNDGGWSGITAQKNTLGRAAALGFVVCATQARVSRSWFIWPSFALLNLILVLGSRSSTSLGAAAGVSLLAVVFLGFRGRKTLYGATLFSMFIVLSLIHI